MPTNLTLEEKQVLTTINYIPADKNIVVEPYEDPANNILVPTEKLKKSSKLIKVDQVSDKELKDLGMATKGALMQNKSSEEQESFIVVAIGPKVDRSEINLGDRLLFKQATQPTGLKIDGKFYLQVESFWSAGRLI